MKIKLAVVALISLTLALPAFGKTYKSTYSMPCSDIWPAVKDVLNDTDNYTVSQSDDTHMTAAYNVKHAAHVTIGGAALQRTNHVTLVQKNDGCEMQVVSNYSGWEHNDRGDFKNRVDESVAKLKGTASAQPAKLEDPK
jgi:hypothetical protein